MIRVSLTPTLCLDSLCPCSLGQISGFLVMKDSLHRFGDTTDAEGDLAFSNSHKGTIVGLLSIGTMLGSLLAATIADRLGRRKYASTITCSK